MKRNIHTTPEQIRTENSDTLISMVNKSIIKSEENTSKIIEAIKSDDKKEEIMGFTGIVKALNRNNESLQEVKETNKQDKIIQKLEEVKSASLITNQELKKISKKESPKEIEISIKGIKVISIKGDDGKVGQIGPRGPKGDSIKGDKGDSIKGDRGPVGPQGPPGKDGESIKGNDGTNGKDGSPDTPEEVVDKVNSSSNKIDPKQVKGLLNLMSLSEQRDMNPVGKDAGGGPKYVFRSNGTVISDHVTEIDYTSGITAVYSGNGRITLSASGGGSGTWYEDEILTRTDGINYTLAHAPTSVVNLYLNGQKLTGGGVDFTRTIASIVMVDATLSSDILTATYS